MTLLEILERLIRQFKDMPPWSWLFFIGAAFVALGIIGGFRDQFRLSKGWQKFAAILGLVMLIAGLGMYWKSPVYEMRELIRLSKEYFEKWKDASETDILSYYQFPMTNFLGEENATREAVKEKLKEDGVTSKRPDDQYLENVSTACASPDHRRDADYCVHIVYKYAVGPRERGVRRHYLYWKNFGGEWKIVGVHEKPFPMGCELK